MKGTGTGEGAAERRLDLDRAAELEKSYDSELRFRDLKGFAAPLVSTLLVALSIFHYYTAGFGILTEHWHKAIHLAAVLSLIMLMFPTRRSLPGPSFGNIPWLDWLLAAAIVVVTLYLPLVFDDLTFRIGMPNFTDVTMGTIMVVLVLEATRRSMGWVLPLIVVIFIAYALFGHLLSGVLAHPGADWQGFVNHVYLTQEGIFGIPANKIRIISPYLGGGFGSKSETHSIYVVAIQASMNLGRPVKMFHSRDEEFMASRTRHPEIIYLKTGVKADGTITARQARVILDNGAYTSYGPGVSLTQSMLGGAVYRIPAYRYDGYTVYTNNPFGGAFRGFGSPQFTFAAECHTDMIAERLGMDAVEFRLKNLSRPGDVAISAMTITGERARVIDFSSPYFDAKQALITPRGSGLDTIEELSGRRVGVQKDTTGETYLSDFAPDDTQVVAFPDAAGLQEALAAGELDAAMLDNTVSGQFVSDNRRLKLAKEFDTGEQYGMAVRRNGNVELLQVVNDVLADLKQDGTYDEIYTEWFGETGA